MVAAVPVSTMLPGCVDITRGVEPDAGRTDWYRLIQTALARARLGERERGG